jgi:adenylate cyclase
MPVNEPDPFSALSATLFSTTRRTIVCVDVVESVRLMEEDEQGTIERWQAIVNYIANQLMPKHGGRLVKSLGDGALMEFVETVAAGRAALALQAFVHAQNQATEARRELHIRIGINLADIVSDQFDIYGRGVNMAARLASLAGPAEIVVSADVRDALTDTVDGDLEDLGECYLKHVEAPVRSYRLGAVGTHPTVPSADALVLAATLAIIPFETASADPDHVVIGDVLADDLIAAVSRAQSLSVVSRLSTKAFRNTTLNLTALRSHLKATYVVSGSYRVVNGRVLISIELADTASEKSVWATSVRADLNELLAGDAPTVPELAAEVVDRIAAHQVSQARAKPLPQLTSNTLFVGAVTLMHRFSRSDFERARQCFEALVDRHKRHAAPMARLAHWHSLSLHQGWSSQRERDTANALSFAERAINSDPESALALTVRGVIATHHLQDPVAGEQYFRKAIEFNPCEPLAWASLGTTFSFRGLGKDALDAAIRAYELSPLDPHRSILQTQIAGAALSANDFQKAIEYANYSVRVNRNHTSNFRILAIANVLLGDIPAAKAAVSELLRLEPGATVSAFLARSPGVKFGIGLRFAEALREAGLPE